MSRSYSTESRSDSSPGSRLLRVFSWRMPRMSITCLAAPRSGSRARVIGFGISPRWRSACVLSPRTKVENVTGSSAGAAPGAALSAAAGRGGGSGVSSATSGRASPLSEKRRRSLTWNPRRSSLSSAMKNVPGRRSGSVRHRAQPPDALLDGGMGAEQAGEPVAAQRVHDPEVRRGGPRGERDAAGRGPDLLERRRQRARRVGELGAARVRLILARARDGELDERRRERRDDDQGGESGRAPTFLPLVAAEPTEERGP